MFLLIIPCFVSIHNRVLVKDRKPENGGSEVQVKERR